jgi:hypothetical protein
MWRVAIEEMPVMLERAMGQAAILGDGAPSFKPG